MFSIATNMIDNAITGSTICVGGEITSYMAKPSVMEWAMVNAVACQMTVFNFGLKKNRQTTNKI